MALTTQSKNTLSALLSLLSEKKDPEVIACLHAAANRRLSADDKVLVQGILPHNGWSQNPQPTEATALSTLLSNIAAS